MNSVLFCSYNIISFLFEQFSLVIKYGKCEVFHLSRFHDIFDPPPIDISQFGGFILKPKDTWKYLGFIFDRKLFDSISSSMLTKLCQQSNAWKCLEILLKVFFLTRNISFIELVYYLLHYMSSLYSTQ